MLEADKVHRLALICVTAAWLASSGTSVAQIQTPSSNDTPSSKDTLKEVVVTATRRKESIQAVPLSITAISVSQLQNRAATSFFDWGSSIPDMSFGYSGGGNEAGASSSRSIAIRGIQGDNTTGFYIDDTPIPDSVDPKLEDISQIEVLRGPQGTLYGALSMGGTVRVLTEQPDLHRLGIMAHASLSDTDHASGANYQVDGSLNLPLIDGRLAMRVSGIHEEDGGYFSRYAEETNTTTNGIGKSITDGGQVEMLWQITDSLSITPRVMYQDTTQNGLPFTVVSYNPSSLTPIVIRPTGLTIVEPFNVPESSSDRWSLSSVTAKYDRGWGSFSLTTSYFSRRTQDVQDQTAFIAETFGIPPIPTNIADQTEPRIQTGELRFVSSFSGPFQFVAGLYQEHTNTSGVAFPDNIVPGLNAATGGALGTDLLYYAAGRSVEIQSAAYTEGTYDITDHWRLTAGVRATRIQDLSGPTFGNGVANGGPTTVSPTSTTSTTTTPKFSLQYRFTPEQQVYATAAEGFRPGAATGGQIPASFCGADAAALGVTIVNGQTSPVQPDTVWSYELGEKTGWFGGRLTTDVDGFRIDWNKIQTSVLLACGFPFETNAGAARSQGVEFEINARVTAGLTIGVSGSYDSATFTETVPGVEFQSGDRIPQVPRVTTQASADYDFPITSETFGFAHIDYRYVGNSWSTNNSLINPNTGRVVPLIRPSYTILDLRAGFDRGPVEYALFVKNLTNELANLSDTNAIAGQATGQSRVAVNAPRTIGVEVRYTH